MPFAGKTIIIGALMILLIRPGRGRAQSTAEASDPPLTPREQALMERIQRLEQSLAALREVEARLAALEAKVSKPSAASDSTTESPVIAGHAPPESAQTAATAPRGQQQPSGGGPSRSDSAGDAANGEPRMWGEWNPGPGFKVASTESGELNLSGYMVARYLNQLPPDQKATDHMGRPIPVQPRQDFQFHRVMLFASGWLLDPKFKYFTFVWTVNDTTQVAVGGTLTYDFHKRFSLGLGFNALPGTRSLQGSHPYWTTYDRVMADEFFRPYFTQGPFGGGELLPRLHYKWMAGNNLSTLGVKATQLTRELNFASSLTWMPTTGEFGPRGAFGDFENHQSVATRFGAAYTLSRENRQSLTSDPVNNTTIRLADSLNLFEKGTLANDVTVEKATYRMAAADAGLKYRGFWIQGEGYARRLDNLVADGPLPVSVIRDFGFYVQTSYMIVPKTVELYGATSYVFSRYGRPKEFIAGANWYPAKSRNYRLNLHHINVDQSPVSSTFGFYMGKISGRVLAIGATALY